MNSWWQMMYWCWAGFTVDGWLVFLFGRWRIDGWLVFLFGKWHIDGWLVFLFGKCCIYVGYYFSLADDVLITLTGFSLCQEAVQKEAFEALQCQKDARHKRVTGQIRLIQQELAELTLLEMEQRSIKLNTQMVGGPMKQLLTHIQPRLLSESFSMAGSKCFRDYILKEDQT